MEDEFNAEVVTILKSEYEELLKNNNWLSCLEAAGVDNWCGFGDAADMLEEAES